MPDLHISLDKARIEDRIHTGLRKGSKRGHPHPGQMQYDLVLALIPKVGNL